MRISEFILCVNLLLPCSSSLKAQALPISSCDKNEVVNANYSRQEALQERLDKLVMQNVPGAVMAIYSKEGWWISAAGYAKLEDQTRMQSCHLMYLQSIAKTYMAVAILKLYERKHIDLNDFITKYLPPHVSQMITRAEEITVRMLLNHTSGIPEYNSQPAYITKLLQEPDHHFEPEDYIKYIKGRSLDFEPGSKYSYRNTNYLLLALIGDELTGDHSKFISDELFRPLGLSRTYYRYQPGYLNYPELTNAYWDRHSDGHIENVSTVQRNNVAAMVGDDGIVTTAVEAVKFLKGLMEGQLLSPETLVLMKSWVNDKNGIPTYGLGIDRDDFVGHIGIGHSGGGIGAGCQLYYFQEEDIYMFFAINLGTVTDSPIHTILTPTVEEIYKIVLE